MVSNKKNFKKSKRTMKRNLKKKSFRKNKRIKQKKKTKRIKKMKGGMRDQRVAGVSVPLESESAPMGYCWKEKPTFKGGLIPSFLDWPKRYIKIEGNSLNVYDNHNRNNKRGSSIEDLTGASVEEGLHDFRGGKLGLQRYPYPLLTITKGTEVVKLLFSRDWESAATNDSPGNVNLDVQGSEKMRQFKAAIENISEGRKWNVSREEEEAAATKIQSRRRGTNVRNKRVLETKKEERVEREKKEAEVELMKINCLEEIPETELPSELGGLTQLRKSLEEKYSHSTIKMDTINKHNLFAGMINQFDKSRGSLEYNPYQYCGEDSYYLSLLQKYNIQPHAALAGSYSVVLKATPREDTVLLNKKCDFLGYNHDKQIQIYLRWEKSGNTTIPLLINRVSYKHELYNKCNTITSLYFPAYARCIEIMLTPQPFLLKMFSTILKPKQLPILFEALLYEGETCKGWDGSIKGECPISDYSQAQQKPLAILHETILKGFLYPLRMIQHENKSRNFTAYEPRVGDNYLFILNTRGNLKLFSCKVTSGVKFRMVIDIEDTMFPRKRPEKLLLQESLTEFAKIMGIKELQLEGEETLENFERGMEHVFDVCSSYLKEEHRFDLDTEYENTHIYVVDSLSWWNLSMPCLVNVTQAREENLQDLLEYKFLIQLLPIMIQSKDDEHKKELLKNNHEIKILISKLPESIGDAILKLINTKSYDFTDIMGLIPENIKQLLQHLLQNII